MLLVASALKGYAIQAQDGRIGTVSDFLFDDRTWQIRWLVVDTGGWLTQRKVLLHPSAVGHADYERQTLPVTLTKVQVKDSPPIFADQPVSRQMEANLYGHYGWAPLWGCSLYGGGLAGSDVGPPRYFGGADLYKEDDSAHGPEDQDPHLRSVAEVTDYRVHASDGEIGHLENLLIDDASWGIRYLIIDTRNWWPGKHVMMSPYAVCDIWLNRQIRLNVTCDQVKGSPPWDPLEMVNQINEKRLHSHYGWPGYGW